MDQVIFVQNVFLGEAPEISYNADYCRVILLDERDRDRPVDEQQGRVLFVGEKFDTEVFKEKKELYLAALCKSVIP